VKCDKCGHIELYWRADWHDVEREYAKTEDVLASLPSEVQAARANEIIEASDGFAYKKGLGRYIRRVPLEVWKARQFWTRPKGYFDPAGRLANGLELVHKVKDREQVMLERFVKEEVSKGREDGAPPGT
jgi:hypothetical protein